MAGTSRKSWGDRGFIGPDRPNGKIAQSLTISKIGIDVASMTLSDATGILPKVRFSDLYFDFESLQMAVWLAAYVAVMIPALQMRVISPQPSLVGLEGKPICC